ncbi:DUF6049 family protein [Actinomadura roseirufa]|uniref:DUF6049 family protein n=1 Tax=Actinomadura roseirufa TaxID=2094049 RepID=UPI0010413145|nr:DUF6049 family protein [Actinomadura roseirufa]
MREVRRAVALAALLPCIMATAVPVTAVPAMAAEPGAAARPDAALPDAALPDAALPDAERSLGHGRARAQVGIALTEIPKTINAKSKIGIAGLAQNKSGHQLGGLTIRLRYGAQPVTSRGQLDQLASGQTPLPAVAGQKILAQVAAPNAKQTFRFSVSAKALGLRTTGGMPAVFPIGVDVLNASQQVVGGVTTFVTSTPARAAYKRVAVGWVWPLMDRQHRADDRTFLNDQLATDVAPGGRLNELVSAASASPQTPVTWGIDPALVDDVREMASHKYFVKPPGAEGADKPQSAAAASWLASLKAALSKSPYFTVPYADPDVVALVRYRMGEWVTRASSPDNTGFVAQTLGAQPSAHIAWPPAGAAGRDTLDLLAKLQLKSGGSFLMGGNQFEDLPQGPANAVTSLPTKTQGTKRTLVYDEKLSQIVSSGSRGPGGPLLTEQRFLAETAVIAAETPNLQRTVIIAPDRHWNPAPGLAKNLLTYTKRAQWLNATPLKSFERPTPQVRQFTNYQENYEAYELGEPYMRQVRGIAGRAATFRAVMTDPIRISYERAVLRTQSASWRFHSARAKQARDELAAELDHEMSKVSIVTTKSKRTTLAGSDGNLVVTVRNSLRGQAVRVRLTAMSENDAKLRLGRPEQEVIPLRPGEMVQRFIPAKAAGNGNFRVYFRLEIPDDPRRRPFREDEIVTVHTAGYGRIALLIIGGGLAVLFVGVGVRAIRARRRRKAEAAGDGSGSGSAAAGGPGDGLPGPGLAGSGLPGSGFPAPGAGPVAGSESPVPGAALPDTYAPASAPASPAAPAGPGTVSGWATGPESAGPEPAWTPSAGPGSAGSASPGSTSATAGPAAPGAGLPASEVSAGPSRAGSPSAFGPPGTGTSSTSPGPSGAESSGAGLPGAGASARAGSAVPGATSPRAGSAASGAASGPSAGAGPEAGAGPASVPSAGPASYAPTGTPSEPAAGISTGTSAGAASGPSHWASGRSASGPSSDASTWPRSGLPGAAGPGATAWSDPGPPEPGSSAARPEDAAGPSDPSADGPAPGEHGGGNRA